MDRSSAIKKLRKLLGPHFGYRINDKAPSRDEKFAAREALDGACRERDRLKQLRDERHRAILTADADYQRLVAEYNSARTLAEHLSATTRHFKMTVGTVSTMFFRIEAEGDSWEDVFAELERKRAREHA